MDYFNNPLLTLTNIYTFTADLMAYYKSQKAMSIY